MPKIKLPDILMDNEAIWKEFLSEQDKPTQLIILKKTKFIIEWIKHLQFNAALRGQGWKAMKYDRIRQFNDIRKKPVEQLARYQVGQLNMIAASDIETLREKNKFLIEDLKAGKGYRVFSETESESEVETETEGEDESENKDEDEGEIEDDQT